MLKHHEKIHKILKEHHPEAVRKAKKIFLLKYPKLLLFAGMILAAYYIFSRPEISVLTEFFNKLGNLGVFIAGGLTSLGFAAPFGFGLLIKMNAGNIFMATLIGGIGAMLADMLIFKTIKVSFMDEFERLEQTKAIKKIEGIVKRNKHVLVWHYLLYVFAGIIIISPLPDEIGVSMLAGLTTIKPVNLAAVSFILHSAAIFLILYFL
jgi:hypothetical protein